MRARVVACAMAIVACGSSDAPASGTGSSGTTATSADATGTAAGSESEVSGEVTSEDTEPDRGEPACAVAGVAGMCAEASSCGEFDAVYQGRCGGHPSTQCCVPEAFACSRLGAPGICVSETECAAPFESFGGVCPGGEVFTCCVEPLARCAADQMPTPNEGLAEEAWDDRCPDGMVHVDFGPGYCIDRYEASLVEVDDSGNVLGSWSPYHAPPLNGVKAVSLRQAVPQSNVTQLQASAACARADKRLCSGTEWELACSGPSFTAFPYGDLQMPGVCNDNHNGIPSYELFGTEEPWVFSHLDHPCLNQLPGTLEVNGQNPGCVSEFGVVDMMGNLTEWTAEPERVRGGHFVVPFGEGAGCYNASFVAPGLGTHLTGFRCCADPQ